MPVSVLPSALKVPDARISIYLQDANLGRGLPI